MELFKSRSCDCVIILYLMNKRKDIEKKTNWRLLLIYAKFIADITMIIGFCIIFVYFLLQVF
ncbi:hypothetical protein H6504_03000 [Candidatus Woesearchaeota archaeon]|nr:hypothetical protein [Candidatus Woesearchaeota archaeon]